MADDLAAMLLTLELDLLSAPGRADASWLGDVLADDFVEFGSSGRTYDKTTVIAVLTDPAASAPSCAIETFAVRLLSPDVALATYQVAGDTIPRSLRSSIWRLEGDRWRLAFHQGTVAAD